MSDGIDIQFEDYGTIVQARPLTEAGRKWLEENAVAENWQWLNGALAIEPRLAAAIARGAVEDGLRVTSDGFTQNTV